jgi:hypothetical protein
LVCSCRPAAYAATAQLCHCSVSTTRTPPFSMSILELCPTLATTELPFAETSRCFCGGGARRCVRAAQLTQPDDGALPAAPLLDPRQHGQQHRRAASPSAVAPHPAAGHHDDSGWSSLSLSLSHHGACVCGRTAMQKLRIVTLGFRVGDHPRSRFTTPADFPRHDCSP